jgi:hypothetical protein
MSLTQNQQAVYTYCDNNDFISPSKFEEFKSDLEAEDNLQTLSFAVEKFIQASCPKCNTEGLFKFHFLGKLNHPQCGQSWYVSPGTYMLKQLGSVFKSGMNIAAETSIDAEKKGEKQGFFATAFMFIIGFVFRLAVALVLIPIQIVVSLLQSKPTPSTN